MAWETVEVEIMATPDLRYTASGLEICTIYDVGQRYVAFGELALDIINSVMPLDTVKFVGYYKAYSGRHDFIIRKWEGV